ncbi:hypothetical protein [Roseateles sp.]|jgi:hypothetical protein|uniref:hypothetical protein n=1 Tax=Roseateles sp. TaxID=1971397 RepID=UPI00391D73FC
MLFQFCSRQHHASQATQAAPRVGTRPAAASSIPAQDKAEGCGWYESSYELNRGLEISEALDEPALGLWFPQATAARLH